MKTNLNNVVGSLLTIGLFANALVGLAYLVVKSPAAQAQSYPNSPTRVIIVGVQMRDANGISHYESLPVRVMNH